jgi:hypothetical protein
MLGGALLERGCFVEARESLTHALGVLPPGDALRQPITQRLQRCDELLALERRWTALLQGQAEVRDQGEWLHLASVCLRHNRTHAAARLFARAFAASPEKASDVAHGYRYQAACAAARTGTGQGQDAQGLTEPEKLALRRLALEQLEDDLRLLAQQCRSGDFRAVLLVTDRLSAWHGDWDLAGVREEKELSRWSAEEQVRWRRLWAEAKQLLRQAGANFRARQVAGILTTKYRTQQHPVQLVAGKTHILDLYCPLYSASFRLEDEQGKTVTHNANPGGQRDVRIVCTPAQTGSYRLVAVLQGGMGGTYTITIRQFTTAK